MPSLTRLALAAAALALALPGVAAAQSPTAASAPSPSPTAAAGESGQAADTLRLVTIGDVAMDLTLARTDDTTLVDSGTGTQLVFADAAGNTGTITFDIDTDADPALMNAFIALGLPGKSIFDPMYFADALHTQCELTPTRVWDTEIAGAFACTDLPSADGTLSIDAFGSFTVTR